MDINIAVLGRGNSLSRYREFSKLFKKIYICGRFYKEIKKIGIKYFLNKEVIHVTCRGSAQLKNEYYQKLNIPYVQTACHSIKKEFCTARGKQHKDKYPKNMELRIVPPFMRDRGYPPLPCDIIEKFCNKYDDYKKLCMFLEKIMPKEILKFSKESRRTRYWPTTGVFAVDLALMENKINNIYLIGLDLYTTVSFVKYKTVGEEFYTPIDTERTRLAFYHIVQLVREFSEVNFYSVSQHKKFNLKLSNWNIF